MENKNFLANLDLDKYFNDQDDKDEIEIIEKEKKIKCNLCNKMINESEIDNHLKRCKTNQTTNQMTNQTHIIKKVEETKTKSKAKTDKKKEIITKNKNNVLEDRIKKIEEKIEKIEDKSVFFIDKIIKSSLKRIFKSYILQYRIKSPDNVESARVLVEYFKIDLDCEDLIKNGNPKTKKK